MQRPMRSMSQSHPSAGYDPLRPGLASSLNHVLNHESVMSPRPSGPGKRTRTYAGFGARPRRVEEVL
jgi:hypothetical protein